MCDERERESERDLRVRLFPRGALIVGGSWRSCCLRKISISSTSGLAGACCCQQKYPVLLALCIFFACLFSALVDFVPLNSHFAVVAMFSFSSVRSISGDTSRFRKSRASSLSQNSSSFEKKRAESIARNEQKLKELGLAPGPEARKLPVFSNKVVPKCDQSKQTKRTRRRNTNASGLTKYLCVDGCNVVSTDVDSFLAHLKSAHELALNTENLAPLGLGLCPFCHGVFAAMRGMSVHLKSCTYPRALLSEMVEGPFPRKCRVWWAGENTWYEGDAEPSRDRENCWQVEYSNGDIENEFCHNVVFDPLPPTVHAEISLPDVSGSWESVCLSPVTMQPSASVACAVSDVDITPGFPTCSPVSASPITTGPMPRATYRSNKSSVLAACDFSDSEKSPVVPVRLPVLASPAAPALPRFEVAESLPSTQIYVPPSPSESLDGKHNTPPPPSPPLSLRRPETSLDRLVDARMELYSSPRQLDAVLEIRDCMPLPDSTERKLLNDLLPEWSVKGSVIPLDFEPTKTNVTQVLIEIQRKAAFLKGFPPLALWRKAQKRNWERATAEFVPYFEKALLVDSHSSEYLIMCLRVLELPSLALKFNLPEQKGISAGKESLSNKLRKVETLTLQNRLHSASKILFSHGIAKPSEALFGRLQKLHPPLKEPIPDLTTSVEQFLISDEDTAKSLYKLCTERWDTPDPYGWNTAMLHLIRNVSDFPGRSFFFFYSTLISDLVQTDVSDLVAYALSSGSIIGLNKDDEETQAIRLEKGLPPRERPINQGSLMLKLVFDLALHSPEAEMAAAALEPIQQGVGAKRGMEMIAHVCNALYSEGYAILKMDATNGFQEIKRASLHRAVAKRCPSLLSLFKKYYTKESTCFFNMESEIKLLTASEGARIGCKMSSFAFGLTVQDLYENIRSRARRAGAGSCMKAATDDIVIVLKADMDDEKVLYAQINDIYSGLQAESHEVGLSFVNDKGQVLLPKNWQPRADLLPPGLLVLSNTFEDPKLRGMEVVGAPIGPPEFCSAFVSKELMRMLRESEDLIELHPQCATKILKDCLCAAPGYLSQVCHPSITKEHLLHFDDCVWDLWVKILGGVAGKSPASCALSMNRSRMKAFLPSRLNGVGLRSWERTGDFAWFASVASCIARDDPDFNFARRFLKRQGESAYEIVLDAIGGPSYLENCNYELIPIGEPDVLSESSFYWDLFEKEKKLRLQKEMLNLANSVAHEKFVNYADDSDDSTKVVIESLKRETVSVLSNLFTANLIQPDVRLTKPEFTAAARQFVCLPPVTNGESAELHELKCGCSVQICTNRKCQDQGRVLDLAGNHGLICNPGVKAKRATLLERALEISFRRAGGHPARQPATYSLLGDIFPKDDVSKLFPGKLNASESAKRKALAMEYLDIMQDIPRGPQRTAELCMLREKFPVAPNVADDDDSKGVIRFDLKFPVPVKGGKERELWIDHAIVQETSPTHAADTLKFLESKNTNLIESSPAFTKTRGGKVRRYSALIDVVNRLAEERKLKFQPTFLYPIVSSLGYMNSDMNELLKSMEKCFKFNQTKARRFDGLEPGVLRGRFKTEMKNTICFALARGNALSICNQGLNGITHPC